MIHLDPARGRRAILERLLAEQRAATSLLAEAAMVVTDGTERTLYARLGEAEARILAELQQEEARLDAEEFVEKAIDV